MIVTEELMDRRTGTAAAVYETFRLGVCAAEKTEAAIQIFALSDRARFNDLDIGKG
ncbi:hypothetical protein [Massilia antarctica]|uniref:hypothetical protein n=1 Tax=Massilia antarctica TaxID=2765360 RepID=UPI0035E9C993